MSVDPEVPPVAGRNALRVSRAEFLRLSGGAGLALSVGGLLGACGTESDSGSSAGARLPAAPSGGSVGGALRYYGWQGYDFPDALKKWRAKRDVKLDAGYITGWEDIPPRLRAGQKFDLTNGDNGYNTIFEELGVLTRMNPDAVPGVASTNQRFVEPFRLKDGSLKGVPFSWGTFALVYNTETVEAPPTTWTDLLEPQFKDRVAALDDATIHIAIAAVQRGQEDMARLTEGELEESTTFLSGIFSQAKAISPSWGDVISLFEKGEVDVAFAGWTALKFFVGQGLKLGVTFPEDRSVSYVATYWVPSTAQNPATAYAYMDEVLSPEVQLQVPGLVGEGIVLTDLAGRLSKEEAELYPYDTVDAFLDQHPYYRIPKLRESGAVTSLRQWQEAYNRLKAA